MRALLVVLVIALLGSSVAMGEDNAAVSYSLPNGLKVSLRPVEDAKSTCIVTLFSVGLVDDPAGKSGLSHLAEHIYNVSASGKTAARTVDKIAEKYPLGWNAQTGCDFTIFATIFPAEQMEAEFTESASRMKELAIGDAEIETEKARILEETANMFERIPWLAAQNLAAERLRPSPNGGRKGGTDAELTALSTEDIKNFIESYYKPNNAVIVISGALDVKVARELIEKLYTEIPTGKPLPERPKAVAPPEKFFETLAVDVAAVAPNTPSEVCLAFPAPDFRDRLFPAFVVLASRLQTRAYSKLKSAPGRQAISYAPFDNPQFLFISLPLEAEQTPEEAVEALDKFVAETVAKRLHPFDVFSTKSNYGFQMGFMEMPDEMIAASPYWVALSLAWKERGSLDPAAMGKLVEAVTQEALDEAAKTIFAPDRRTAVVVITQ
ncbi:MAG: pitrilysin family protein [Candidatus Brocadiia bacterium]